MSLLGDVKLWQCSSRFFDLEVQQEPGGPRWRLTFVYGEPRVENRKHVWELLKELYKLSALPWVVMGDFNEAMWAFEHFSESV